MESTSIFHHMHIYQFFFPEFLFGPYQSIINSKSFQLGWKLKKRCFSFLDNK